MSQKALNYMIRPRTISTPFVKASFGGVDFGLTGEKNTVTKTLKADFITGLNVKKYGSGAVNTYTLNLKYVITPESDPNYVDLVISKAVDRKIFFTYGDLSEPGYSYKNEEAIITSIKPRVNYKQNTIDYTIMATSSASLSYSIKRNFEAVKDKPSNVILSILYNTPDCGLLEIFRGMINKDTVLGNKWIPTDDEVVNIAEKRDFSPIDYLLYLVSLMKSDSNNYYTLRIVDGDTGQLPYFKIISTGNKDESKMMVISIGYPGSIPVYDFSIDENSSIALMVDYKEKLDKGLYQDYSFRGDLMTSTYYSDQVIEGTPSENIKKWWDKMRAFPLTATLVTDGLYLPVELIQSVYLDIGFFGKKYNHSGEYIITGQEDNISSAGYFTTLSLMRIDNV